jgi:hypothetical protein
MEENEKGRDGDKKQEKQEHKDDELLFLYNLYFSYP